MAPGYREAFHMDGSPLRLEYSAAGRAPATLAMDGSGGAGGSRDGGGVGGAASGSHDWLCDSCNTSNFARCFTGGRNVM